MENNAASVSHAPLNDLLDDLTPNEMTSMLNWMFVEGLEVTRSNVKYFRVNYLNK